MMINANRFMHLSVDDVIHCFKWIYNNKPNSIFEEPFLSILKIIHNSYNLDIDLFIFEYDEDFRIEQLPDIYWEEMKENSGWLKYGWHQIHPGEIKESVDLQIESATRVINLIKNKCGINAYSRCLRLHMWIGEKELINTLRDYGITCFLTADSRKIVSYDLSNSQCELLDETGDFPDVDRKLMFRRTDIRLDNLEKCEIDELLERAYVLINTRPGLHRIETFCHEERIKDIWTKIPQFIDKLSGINKKLYINATTRVGNRVYFTDIFSSNLYSIEFDTKEVDLVGYIGNECIGEMRYSSLIYYDGKIWMIPWRGKHFVVYDLKQHSAYRLIFPQKTHINEMDLECRKAVKYKNFLWILPMCGEMLIRIDLDNQTVCPVKDFPSEVSFNKNTKMMFKCMDLLDDRIYLFRDGCSHNLIVDAETGEISIWNSDFGGCFGCMIDETHALLAPIDKGDALRVYNSANREFKSFYLPEDIWSDVLFYAFWYCSKVEDYIYILPHEAKGIIKYSIKNDNIEIVRSPNVAFLTMRHNEGFSGYDAWQVDDKVWAFPIMGNQIVELSNKGKDTSINSVEIPLEKAYKKPRINDGDFMLFEHNNLEFEDLLDKICNFNYEDIYLQEVSIR